MEIVASRGSGLKNGRVGVEGGVGSENRVSKGEGPTSTNFLDVPILLDGTGTFPLLYSS